MTKPQHICLLALLSTANGLITLPSSALQRESIRSPCSSALQYQEDAFIDVEILSKVDRIRFQSGTVGVIGGSTSSRETSSSTYRDIRIPMKWYPQHDVKSDSSSCSAYRREESKGTVIVRVLEWKKQAGDVVKQGDVMVIMEKSHIDCYGRTVDKQRIEVASKDDGILKSILIPQNHELDLSELQFQSSLALFHPTQFHCIEIDEITRMDTTLLLIDETEPPEKETMNDTNGQDLSLSSETIDTAQDIEKTDIGNGTCTTNEKNIHIQEDIILEEEAMPAASNGLLDFKQDVENCMNSTAELNHTICEEELTLNATVLEANARNIAQSAINATNACSTRQDGSSQEEVVCKESEHEYFPSEPNAFHSLDPKLEEIAECKHGIASTTILEGQETVPATGDDVALEEHHADTQNDPESSLALEVDDEELDLERIVDIAANIVAEVLFGEASTNNPTYNSASGPDDAEPANDVSITVEEAWEDIQITHSSSCEDGEGEQASIDLLETEEVWGSQKAQVFDAVMDFFTTTFQKTN